MITVREATLDDVGEVRDLFRIEYGEGGALPQSYDTDALARFVYTDGSILLVAVDSASRQVVGTASVLFGVGGYNDLIGEFGRLIVHPEFRGRGIGQQLTQARIERVKSRIHVGLVEHPARHDFSQRISRDLGFVPVGFIPMKLAREQRESVLVCARHFGDALCLRRNNPRIIPEASSLATIALGNCGLPQDAIIDDASSPYLHDDGFQLEELETDGYAALLRIERGRLRHRDIFGPVRLHYGLFQLQARRSHYLIARRDGQVMGGIGFMIDEAEKALRVFEMIAVTEEPIRFLLQGLMRKCQAEQKIEYAEIDVSAYAPRMQRTLLELGFLPVSYVPACVFHEVERLDAIKMSKLFVPLESSERQILDVGKPVAEAVTKHFVGKEALPRMLDVAQHTKLFHDLNDEQRRCLLGICEARKFAASEAIFEQGWRDSTMHLIVVGEVELMAGDAHVAIVTAGHCIGESTLLHAPGVGTAHSLDAVARTPVETAAFESSALSELVRRRPDIGVVLYRNLAHDISAKLRRFSN